MTHVQEAETAAPMVSCFSYLAHVHTLHVTAMPPLNYGVDVEHTEEFVAGDGPLVAASLRGLGYPAVLYSNPVADDHLGRSVRARLMEWNITLRTNATRAEHTLEDLCQLDAAELTVVTAGRYGAIGHVHTGQNATAQAIPVPLRQTQGAGAAFSAGLIHRLQHGDDLQEILRFACAAGSRWCSRPFGDPLPNEAEIDAFADRAPTNSR